MGRLFLLLLLLFPLRAEANIWNPQDYFQWNTQQLTPDHGYVEFSFIYRDTYMIHDVMLNGKIWLQSPSGKKVVLAQNIDSYTGELRFSLNVGSQYTEQMTEYGFLEYVDTWWDGKYHKMARFRYYPGRQVASASRLAPWKFYYYFDWDVNNDRGTIFTKIDASPTIVQTIPFCSVTTQDADPETVTFDRRGGRQTTWAASKSIRNIPGNISRYMMLSQYNVVTAYNFNIESTSPQSLSRIASQPWTGTFESTSVSDRQPLNLQYYTYVKELRFHGSSTLVSSIKTVTLPGFPWASNLSAMTADQWRRHVKLTWASQYNSNADKTGRWYLYRRLRDNPSAPLTLLTPDGLDYSAYSYTDSVPDVSTPYTYIVSYAKPEWDNSEPVADLQASCSYILQPEFRFIGTTAAANPSSSSDISVSFSHTIVPEYAQAEIRLYHYTDEMGRDNAELLKTWTYEAGRDGSVQTAQFEHNTGSTNRSAHHYYLESSAISTQFQSPTFTGTVTGSNYMTSFESTRGTYADAVHLTWQSHIRNARVNTYYNVQRRELGTLQRTASSQTDDWLTIASLEGTSTIMTYEDRLVEPGKYYEYRITQSVREDVFDDSGHVVEEGGREVVTSEMLADGFCLSSGIISGRITYGNGTAVADAIVDVARDDDGLGSAFYALSADTDIDTLVTVTDKRIAQHLASAEGATFQAWIRIDPASQSCTLADIGGRYRLQAQKVEADTTFVLKLSGTGYDATGGITLKSDCYYMVTIRMQGNKARLSVLDDSEEPQLMTKEYTVGTAVITSAMSLGVAPDSDHRFRGLVDEVRLWSAVLTDEQILTDFDRPLSGTESNLLLYWPLDEGLASLPRAYDYSKTSAVANSMHGNVNSRATSQPVTPSCLRLYGRTDERGNYVVRGIPFSSEGTNYIIRPRKNLHVFSPSFDTRMISKSSLSHSSVNLYDVSSFEVSGDAYYEGTLCPVVGATVYVDGSAAHSGTGDDVTTDDAGCFVVDVPIANHYIELRKEGHTFYAGGRWPVDTAHVGTVHEFTAPVSGLRFTDQTLVPVVGRVVGGNTEGRKPLGLGASQANIGQAKIVLEAGYPLNVAEQRNGTVVDYVAQTSPRTLERVNEDVENRTYIVGATAADNFDSTSRIEIFTDIRHGEFTAMVPPLNYRVVSVGIPSNASIDFGDDQTLFNCSNATDYVTDTLLLNEDDFPQSMRYVESLRKIYHTPPVMRVWDALNPHGDKGVFGTDSISYVGRDGFVAPRRIPAYTYDEDADQLTNYTFGYPVLDSYDSSPNAYIIKVYEPFENRDMVAEGGEAVLYEEPVQFCDVKVYNSFSSSVPVIYEGEYRGKRVATNNSMAELVTDSIGTARYEFYTGLPNIVGDHTLGMNITFDIDTIIN